MSSSASFAELSEILGEDGALALLETFGGVAVTVPARPRAGHPLVRVVGLPAVKLLYDRYGPTKLNLPLGPERGQAGRRAYLARLIQQGWSVAEAARMADVHERTGWNVKGKLKASLPLLEELPEADRGGLPKKASR